MLIPNKVNRIALIVVGCFISVVGAFLTGPSKLFGLPDTIGLMTGGMIASGIGKAIV